MNWKQVTFISVGILILVSMVICPPVTIGMMSLYFYAGDPNAGMNFMTFYRFMPEGWPKVINYPVLFWQCFILCVMIFCNVFAFRDDAKKPKQEIEKGEVVLTIIFFLVSLIFFLLWFVDAALKNEFRFQLNLLKAGVVGLLGTFIAVNVYLNKKRGVLLSFILFSCAGLSLCMIISHSAYRYSPDEFKFTPNIWRFLGGLIFIAIWGFYFIVQLIQRKRNTISRGLTA